jgi:hypothetical protein
MPRPAKKVKKVVSKRKQQIDDAVEKAQTGKKPAAKKPVAPKNPYKEGSARNKMWARREAERKKKQ